MRLELILEHTVMASHSLKGNEAPHPHLWKLELGVTGDPIEGKIVDLPALSRAVNECLQPFEGVYLNDCADLEKESRAYPTCESLAVTWMKRLDNQVFHFLRQANPSLKLARLKITLCDLNGRSWGAAQLLA